MPRTGSSTARHGRIGYALAHLAEPVGFDIYIYYEGDSRRGFVETIHPINAVFLVHPDGTVDPGIRPPSILRSPFGRLIWWSRIAPGLVRAVRAFPTRLQRLRLGDLVKRAAMVVPT